MFFGEGCAVTIILFINLSAAWPKAQRRPFYDVHDLGFNPNPSHVFASLDKTLYDDYLCLVASTKQQIYVSKSETSTE